MEFRTIVDIPAPAFSIAPCEPLLFVGSCFADNIGQRFRAEGFPIVVNPFGTMYNPASILHTIQRLVLSPVPPYPRTPVPSHATTPAVSTAGPAAAVPAASPAGIPSTAFITLGTNHVYRLKSTGEIVDNCQKRPAALFQEEELSVDQCADYLRQSITLLRQLNPDIRIVLTVSPIRYRKYGYHGSQLSKATLLLAIAKLAASGSPAGPPTTPAMSTVGPLSSLLPPPSSSRTPVPPHPRTPASLLSYFPAYEILTDELRDYRFYAADMLHPSEQAVEYIWERLVDTYFSPEAKAFLDEWRPMKQALAHKPFNPDAPEYQAFMDKTMLKVEEIRKKYTTFAL